MLVACNLRTSTPVLRSTHHTKLIETASVRHTAARSAKRSKCKYSIDGALLADNRWSLALTFKRYFALCFVIFLMNWWNWSTLFSLQRLILSNSYHANWQLCRNTERINSKISFLFAEKLRLQLTIAIVLTLSNSINIVIDSCDSLCLDPQLGRRSARNGST